MGLRQLDGPARDLLGDQRADAEMRVPDLQTADAGDALRLGDAAVAKAAVHVAQIARVAVHTVAVDAVAGIPREDLGKAMGLVPGHIAKEPALHGLDGLLIGDNQHVVSSLWVVTGKHGLSFFAAQALPSAEGVPEEAAPFFFPRPLILRQARKSLSSIAALCFIIR